MIACVKNIAKDAAYSHQKPYITMRGKRQVIFVRFGVLFNFGHDTCVFTCNSSIFAQYFDKSIEMR